MTETTNDNILTKILASVGLEKFSDYIINLFKHSSNKTIEEFLIKQLIKAVIRLYSELENKKTENKKLNEIIDKFKLSTKTLQKMLFGQKSEKEKSKENSTENKKSDDDKERNLEKNDSEKENKKNPCSDDKSEKKKKRKDINYDKPPSRNKIDKNLKRVVIIHRGECSCSKCNKPYIESGMYSCSEELAVKFYVYVILHKRAKLLPDCECGEGPAIYTAPKIGSVMYKGKYSNSLISFLLMSKFYLQVPIHRQKVKLFGNYGSQISEGTVNGIFKYLHENVLKQFYTAIKVKTLESEHFHGDETSWKVFTDKKGKKTYNHWIWVVASSCGISYIYDPTRSKSVVLRVFPPDAKGIINVDRYAAYNALPEHIRRSFCWQHMKRDMIRLAEGVPQLRKWANKWIKTIQKIERLNDTRFEEYSNLDSSGELSHKYIKLHKRLHSLLSAFHKRVTAQFENKELHELAKKTLKSILKHWDGYIVFYEFPLIPMNNNYSERLLRVVANCRNNFLGSHASWNAELMAMVLSICETSKLYGLNPYAYMEYILTQCSLYENRQIPDIQSVMPWNITPQILAPYEDMESPIPDINQECNHKSKYSHDTNYPEEILKNASENQNLIESDLQETQDKCDSNNLLLVVAPNSNYDLDEDICTYEPCEPYEPLLNNASTYNTSDIINCDTTSNLVLESNKKTPLFALLAIIIALFVSKSFNNSTFTQHQPLYSDILLHKPFFVTLYNNNYTFQISYISTADEAIGAITRESLFVGLYDDTS